MLIPTIGTRSTVLMIMNAPKVQLPR